MTSSAYTFRGVLLAVIFLVSAGGTVCAQDIIENPRVSFNDGPGIQKTNLFQLRVNQLLGAVNARKLNNQEFDPQLVSIVFRGEDGEYGLGELNKLLEAADFYVTEEFQIGQIFELIDGTFEIRQIFVEIGKEVEHEHEKRQELIVNIKPEGTIYGIRFALQQHRFDEILNASMSVEDQFRRMQIVNYLERFRTAYNKKDIEFIEQQFSEQALIITGTRIISTPDEQLEPTETKVDKQQYQYLRQTKEQYISRLRDVVFKRNAFINIEFEDIKIMRHPVYPEVYGINLYQIWNTSTYSDVGFLFLLIDYENELQPKIYVRAWQENPFEDGSVIEMDMFELIK